MVETIVMVVGNIAVWGFVAFSAFILWFGQPRKEGRE